jgi:hypothetical protein
MITERYERQRVVTGVNDHVDVMVIEGMSMKQAFDKMLHQYQGVRP